MEEDRGKPVQLEYARPARRHTVMKSLMPEPWSAWRSAARWVFWGTTVLAGLFALVFILFMVLLHLRWQPPAR